MRRRSASPEAETMSYCPPPPPAMSETISLEDPAYLELTWQPVCFSNGCTQSGCVYPSQAMRFSWPSVFPIEVGTAASCIGGFRPATAPLPPPVDEGPGPAEPQPDNSMPTARTAV